MAFKEKTVSEKEFQEAFVQYLHDKGKGWVCPDELDGNKHRVTVDTLVDHWRSELNRLNSDQLEQVPLTDNEFAQVMAKVRQIKNSYEAAKILAMEGGKGKIDGIYRDEQEGVTRKQVTLTIFKKTAIRGGDSSYKVAREVWGKDDKHRFDLVLLINGLPLINIEQKKADKDLDEAFGQFKRYYKYGEFSHNFMAFSQMMVVTSPIETRYFATPKNLESFNPAFVFHWADEQNKPINDWQKVIEKLLVIPMSHQMVGDYLIIDEAEREEDRRHMLMRPYQVYALQAVEHATFGRNKDGIPHGGFIWHTTGSGKTITSFKTAMVLSTRTAFEKVIFLVDRKDLDNRTGLNFKAYASYEAVDVDTTASTYQLKQRLREAKNGIIVTTTQKLNSLVTELEENGDQSLSGKKLIFIIDEAHRTTMGDMMGRIKNYFRQKAIFFGFTGTPLFEENKVKGAIDEQSHYIDTTEKLFGPLLHKYTIDQAILDKNVLGFQVDYINTGEFASYDDLRQRLLDRRCQESPDKTERQIEREIFKLSEADLERQKLFSYDDKTHIPRVVDLILKNWDQQSQNRDFNAILTVAEKNRVIAYYHAFKEAQKGLENPITVAMTFSFGNENDPDNPAPKIVEEMFADYEQKTGLTFIPGSQDKGEAAYFEDLIDRTTKGGTSRGPKNIDLVIVADQLLTGYDSKRLNTLYVDRPLKLQGLIQAYSRTNRVFGSNKEFGSVVNFQYPAITREQVDKALKLYGSGGESSRVIVEPYETVVSQFRSAVPALRESLPEPSDWQLLVSDEEKEAFKQAFKTVNKALNTLRQYYQFSWDSETFGISEGDYLAYQGAYRNIFKPKGPGVNLIPPAQLGQARLIDFQLVDANYIIHLIDSRLVAENNVQTIDGESLRLVYEHIEQLSQQGYHDQAEQLRIFVREELETGHIPAGTSFDQAFDQWKRSKKSRALADFAQTWQVDLDFLEKVAQLYQQSEPDELPRKGEFTDFVQTDLKGPKRSKYLNSLKTSLLDLLQELTI